jgi:hypothetical protein
MILVKNIVGAATTRTETETGVSTQEVKVVNKSDPQDRSTTKDRITVGNSGRIEVAKKDPL